MTVLYSTKAPLDPTSTSSSPAWLWLHPSFFLSQFPSQAYHPKNACDVQKVKGHQNIQKWKRICWLPAAQASQDSFVRKSISTLHTTKNKSISFLKSDSEHICNSENRAIRVSKYFRMRHFTVSLDFFEVHLISY